jgi:hypothetical protein
MSGPVDSDLHIRIVFEKGFDGIDKGPFLLEVERLARRILGVRAEVFMDRMRDQNKPRQMLRKEDVI